MDVAVYELAKLLSLLYLGVFPVLAYENIRGRFMVFSSVIFLFCFLPITLALTLLSPKPLRNSILLLMSLLFYWWGEGIFVLLMLASILTNYLAGLALARFQKRKMVLTLAVLINLGLLAFYKYAAFLVDNLNLLLATSDEPLIAPVEVHLPIGISFFTFQALSYVIDVYRGETEVQRNPFDLALYIAMFPQLIAGPIVRYHDVATQIRNRIVSNELFASGVRRFIVGLAKKVFLANVLGRVADQVFAMDPSTLGTGTAWLGIICYAFQIYFDFSGYSDMAIGLGRMFGFRFLENFNYPYIAGSIQDFWRRWHISLSSWFRDYLYIPLGGNRVGPVRLYLNLVTVFFLCGLWHGASWNFVIWGLIHGLFLVIERLGLAKLLRKLPYPFGLAYVLFVVLIGWVFFRVETLPDAWTFLLAMFGQGSVAAEPVYLLTPEVRLTLVLATLGATPILKHFWTFNDPPQQHILGGSLRLLRTLAATSLLIFTAVYLAADTYNPFIYFRF